MSVDKDKYLLALHSSSEKLGVGILNLKDPGLNIHNSTFESGRELANNLFKNVIYEKKNISVDRYSCFNRDRAH